MKFMLISRCLNTVQLILVSSLYYTWFTPLPGFHTVGEYLPPPPPNLSSPPRFQAKCIATCSNISATSFLGPQKPPEATSERPKFKHFLRERTPRPPRSSVLHTIDSNKTSCMKTLITNGLVNSND